MLNSKKIRNGLVLPVIFFLGWLSFTGCKDRSREIGAKIPSTQPVKLSAIMEDPALYNGKQVVLKGVITGQCASLCELFIRDGVDKATLFAEGFKFPKLAAGKPVTVFAKVTAGPENVIFSALGVRVEPGKKT